METRSSKRRRLLLLKSSDDQKEETAASTTTTGADDRLTDLPDAVLHHILLLLPIKTVAQTSTLTKRWRHLWHSIPDLDFNTLIPLSNTDLITPSPTTNTSGSRRKRLNAPPSSREMDSISDVLTLRDKRNSDVRVVRFRARLTFTRLNAVIRLALRRNVKELDMEITTCDYFNLPRSLVRSGSLRFLRLKSRYPGFRLPPASVLRGGGFRSLETLSLSLVILYDQPSLRDLFTDDTGSFPVLRKLSLDACFGLKDLKVACRLLEELTLENCFQLRGLEVVGQRLERLRVSSCFDAYCDQCWVKVSGTPRLRCVVWEYNALTDQCTVGGLECLEEASVGFFLLHDQEGISVSKAWAVCDLFRGLSHARSLTFQHPCVEILSKNNHLGMGMALPDPFTNLRTLELQMGFNKADAPGLAWIFKSSPCLHNLVIKIMSDYKTERRQWSRDIWDMSISGEERYWESQAQGLKWFLHQLKVVRIHGFSECENEISLVKFLLRHGRALQEMTVCSGQCHPRDSLRRDKIKSQMMGFSWASSNAKIEFR